MLIAAVALLSLLLGVAMAIAVGVWIIISQLADLKAIGLAIVKAILGPQE